MLQRALVETLETPENKGEDRAAGLVDLETALLVAPPDSFAQLRALLAKAVHSEDKDGKDLIAARKAFEEGSEATTLSAVNMVDGESTAVSARPAAPFVPYVVSKDVRVALRCAMALTFLRRDASTDSSRIAAVKLINEISLSETSSQSRNADLLGYTAAWKAMQKFSADPELFKWAAEGLEKIAIALRVWIGSMEGRDSGLNKAERAQIVEGCLNVAKSLNGMSTEEPEDEEGYGSLTEDGSVVDDR